MPFSASSFGGTVLFNTETDPNNWYDPTTGIFLPTTAGMYRLSWAVAMNNVVVADKFITSSVVYQALTTLYGSVSYQRGNRGIVTVGTAMLPFNGTTDSAKVRLETDDTATTLTLDSTTQITHFEAHRIGT
jgi:thymidylate kinase